MESLSAIPPDALAAILGLPIDTFKAIPSNRDRVVIASTGEGRLYQAAVLDLATSTSHPFGPQHLALEEAEQSMTVKHRVRLTRGRSLVPACGGQAQRGVG